MYGLCYKCIVARLYITMQLFHQPEVAYTGFGRA